MKGFPKENIESANGEPLFEMGGAVCSALLLLLKQYKGEESVNCYKRKWEAVLFPIKCILQKDENGAFGFSNGMVRSLLMPLRAMAFD